MRVQCSEQGLVPVGAKYTRIQKRGPKYTRVYQPTDATAAYTDPCCPRTNGFLYRLGCKSGHRGAAAAVSPQMSVNCNDKKLETQFLSCPGRISGLGGYERPACGTAWS